MLIAALLALPARRKLGAGRTNGAGGDTGDIEGVPGHVIQIASWANVAAAARLKPVEAQQQACNAALPFAASWVRFRGGTWRIVLTPEQWAAYAAADPAIAEIRPAIGTAAGFLAARKASALMRSMSCAALPQRRTTMACRWARWWVWIPGGRWDRATRRGSARDLRPPGPAGWRWSGGWPRPSCGSPSACRCWRSGRKLARMGGAATSRPSTATSTLARERMVEELITDRHRHQAEQIFALNECARRAMDAEQFSAAVGAFRVIAEIGGLLRAPIKPPEPRA